MRDNPFCSGDLVKKLERLGAETLMGPVRDWISYSTWRFARDSRRKGQSYGGSYAPRLRDFSST